MKPSLLILLIFLLLAACTSAFTGETKMNIAYLVLSEKMNAEDSAAIAWLNEAGSFKTTVQSVAEGKKDLENIDAAWIHIPDSAAYLNWIAVKAKWQWLADYIQNSGSLLLTDYAAFLPYDLGIESLQPEVRILEIKDNWLFDKKGFQSFRGHPLFTGLFGGAFVWDAFEDQKVPTIGYFGDNFPKQGKVVATEKSYITIHGDNKLVIEHDYGKGKIISAGGFVYLAKRNRLDLKLKQFLFNSLAYLSGQLAGQPATYWRNYKNQPKIFQIYTKPLAGKNAAGPLDLKNISGMLLSREHPRNNYYDVSGRRALVMGKENGGIDELWVHPFRVLRDYEAGLVQEDSIAWLKHLPVKIEIRPESFTRIYQTPAGQLRETILPALHKPGAVLQYTLDSSQSVRLIIKFRSDLRWMWPYDQDAIGDVWYGYDDALQALHLKDSAGDFYCVIGGDAKPVRYVSGQYEDISWRNGNFKSTPTDLNQVYHAYEYHIGPGKPVLDFAVVGTNNGQGEALSQYHRLLEELPSVYETAFDHYESLIANSLVITSPDTEFNRLWKWAIVGTDRFLVTTPPLGTALVAGYATTARGWDGGQKISGRPGYAWYFGRDSEWSGFAIDNYGDFNAVRQQLDFLQKFQDIYGKIFHEISTSGVVHYDAADATPLYIILAAHYLRASGDVEFIKRSWPHIQKAIEFLYSTDSDGDHLIENTNVGHGWVEGGKLWGANTTLYLAALWRQVLRDAAYMASHTGNGSLEEKYRQDGLEVEKIINNDFWNDSTGFFNYGKLADGTYNPERTALPAVAMYYNIPEEKKVKFMLQAFAGNGFSADWGVRILSSESPLFNPRGYHYGSIWPLFTGWTALAEYAYGNSVQGFTHIVNNMLIKNYWALGFVEEVMNGETYQPSGVCPHQCWSETNILHPGITGMLGWQPWAPEKSATLAPRFPLDWNEVSVTNLRVGQSVIEFSEKQSPNRTVYGFHLKHGPAIQLNFAPQIPAGMSIKSVTVDSRPVTVSAETERGLLQNPVVFKIKDNHEIVFEHTKGVGLVPKIPHPAPGDTSSGYRIIQARLNGIKYTMDLEGKSGSETVFEICTFDQKIKKVDGGIILTQNPFDPAQIRLTFPEGPKPFNRKKLTIFLEPNKP